MSSTITDGTTTVTPDAVIAYQSDQAAGNVLHPIIGSASDAVTLRPAGLRSGRMETVCASLAVAQSLRALVGSAARLTFADTTSASLGMTFVLAGRMSLQLEPQSGAAWLVSFDYQEIS